MHVEAHEYYQASVTVWNGPDADSVVLSYALGNGETENPIVPGDPQGYGNFGYVTIHGVNSIVFQGGDGSDYFANNSTKSDFADGGEGNDVLVGGFGASSQLYGGEGNDIVWGRSGNSFLDGGDGTDYIIRNNTITIA